MKKAKRRIFSGIVCEQIVFNVPDRVRDIKNAKPRPRFKTEEEREQHRLGISRRNHARLFNANFGPTSLYSTLTFDNEWEVHTFGEARRLRDNYARRLMYHYQNAKVIIYMGRGKGTHRIHLHMVSEGIPEDAITKLWGMGEIVRIEHLREHNYYNGVDHGKDYTGLANYLFDHWTKEQGGHRWKKVGKLVKPDPEPAKLVKRNYTLKKPPQPPKGYILVEGKETPYGYLYFKYVLKPEPQKRTQRKRAGTGGE